ncbi:MAG: hypothetical protein O2972_04475 [Cyanobacteria bacterium]|jgi:hypothetical protein|nr:hypothetical protein [Synechococcus sp. BS307-5m-G38]MDA0257929.1 hypothetical protein [Cyanobacteriota bacterium]
MTSCPWPRRRAPIDRLRDWWTPPAKPAVKDVTADQNHEQLWNTLMQGGFWLS